MFLCFAKTCAYATHAQFSKRDCLASVTVCFYTCDAPCTKAPCHLVSSKFFLVPVALERILFVFVLVICCHDTHTHLYMLRVQSVVALFLAGNVCSEVCSHRVHQLSPFTVVFFFSPYFF